MKRKENIVSGLSRITLGYLYEVLAGLCGYVDKQIELHEKGPRIIIYIFYDFIHADM